MSGLCPSCIPCASPASSQSAGPGEPGRGPDASQTPQNGAAAAVGPATARASSASHSESAMGHRQAGKQLPRLARPRLVASLVAWAALASLLVLHRSHWHARKCIDAAVGGDAAAAASGGGGGGGVQATFAGRYDGLSREQIEALIRAPAGLWGRVQKGGMPANFPFVHAHLTDTNPFVREEGIPATLGPAVFRWFAKAYMYKKAFGVSNHDLQSPIPACHFWADHKYKVLYVRNFKTAGTSITISLGQKELPMYCTHRPATCDKKCQNKPMCFENVSAMDKLQEYFANYTVFTFVRNPWARALSSWHHVHKHGMHPPCKESFPKWAELPSRYGAKCLAELGCCRRRFGWLLEHMEPQSTCLFDDQGRPAVDFVGRVENLDDDMQELVKLINSRLPPGVQPLHVGRLPRWQLSVAELANKQEELWRYYSTMYHNSSIAMSDIRSYFHADFDLLRIKDVA